MDSGDLVNTEEAARKWFKEASFKELLGHDSSHKTMFLLLSHVSGEEGIMLANKSPFSEDVREIKGFLSNVNLTEIGRNDIFGSYDISVPAELNLIKAQLIYPANERLIAKYRQEEKYIIRESPKDYQNITKAYIEKYQLNLNWVYNILEKKSEVDRCIYEDDDKHNGFMLMHDIKWDGKTLENLYVLAIVNRHGLKSVRDLTADDIPMLENVRLKSLKAIHDRYGIREDQIKCYFHYQPSFYHLHVHFVNLKYDAPGSSTLSAIVLDDVINNLKMNGEHYRNSTLTFTRKKTDKLFELFREAGSSKPI